MCGLLREESFERGGARIDDGWVCSIKGDPETPNIATPC
jgi:hypothetical protein